MFYKLVKRNDKMNENLIKEASDVSNILKVLSNKNRLLIVCFLIGKEKTVSDINLELPELSQSAVSQHLRILKMNGIVENDKRGMNIYYSIKDERIIFLIKCLRDNFCSQDITFDKE